MYLTLYFSFYTHRRKNQLNKLTSNAKTARALADGSICNEIGSNNKRSIQCSTPANGSMEHKQSKERIDERERDRERENHTESFAPLSTMHKHCILLRAHRIFHSKNWYKNAPYLSKRILFDIIAHAYAPNGMQ